MCEINKFKPECIGMAPINAAVAAIERELLNMIENPNTPQKLAITRKIRREAALKCSAVKSAGSRCRSKAMIHANKVATITIMIA